MQNTKEMKSLICKSFTSYPCKPRAYNQESDPTEIQPEDDSLGAGVVILIVVMSLAFFLIVFYLWRIYVRRQMMYDMQEQVNSQVSQYFAINDSNTTLKWILYNDFVFIKYNFFYLAINYQILFSK